MLLTPPAFNIVQHTAVYRPIKDFKFCNISKHGCGQTSAVDMTLGINGISSNILSNHSANIIRSIHELLRPEIAIVDRITHTTQYAAHNRFAATNTTAHCHQTIRSHQCSITYSTLSGLRLTTLSPSGISGRLTWARVAPRRIFLKSTSAFARKDIELIRIGTRYCTDTAAG